MRSGVGAFCRGTNFVARRRLLWVVAVLCAVLAWLVWEVLDAADGLFVCFLRVAARSAASGPSIARATKANTHLFICLWDAPDRSI